MSVTVTVLGTFVVLGVILVARYGADSRRGADPTGRDPAWPADPGREHTPREDLALLAAWTRGVARHRRCWELFDAAQRPWEKAAPLRSPGAGRGGRAR